MDCGAVADALEATAAGAEAGDGWLREAEGGVLAAAGEGAPPSAAAAAAALRAMLSARSEDGFFLECSSDARIHNIFE